MSSKPGKQVTTSAPDAASQRYINAMRSRGRTASNVALGGPDSYFTGPLSGADIDAAMNPWISGVVDNIRNQYDVRAQRGARDLGQGATKAGAFGGSRHGVAEGIMRGEMARSEAGQVANLMREGYGQALNLAEHNRSLEQQQLMEPLFRQQQALNFMNLGLGPVGTKTTQTAKKGRNPVGGAMSGAAIGTAIAPGIGTVIGGGLGLLGSYL